MQNVRKSDHLQSRLSPGNAHTTGCELKVKKTGKGLIEATNTSRLWLAQGLLTPPHGLLRLRRPW